ncbi:unnamed protein product [Thelazia callipaeda]|uniref:F-box domain-containing protein n=1 Tax=Thelazia callipaeda TaxID=103827 RepID=A0A0N5D9D9_THECL|nr:unnamed protein product [Thelazia callipaeda]
MITLEVIIRGIEVQQSSWPDEVLKAVLDRFERMALVSISVLREVCVRNQHSRTEETSECCNHQYCKSSILVRRYLEEQTKRVEVQDTYFDQNALHESKGYLNVKEKYLVVMQEAQGCEMDQTKWTQKIISEKGDPLTLGAVNQAAGEYASEPHKVND